MMRFYSSTMRCCFSTTPPPNPATEQNVLATASSTTPPPNTTTELIVLSTARERYTTPHAIWEALSTDHVKLLRASYLVKLAREGRVLCRRQELPPDAFIGVEELKSLYGDGNRDGVLPVLSVSFCWDTPPHPDPSGKQVATVAAGLEREMPEYAKMGFTEMGVFWDWAALYQKDPALFDSTKTPEAKPEGPERDAFLEDLKEKRAFYGGEAYEQSRTPDQKEAFGRALHNTMDLWYAHQGTTVYLLTQLPKGTRRKLGYDDSGWTTYERRSAEQIKKVYLYEAKWKLVRDLGSGDLDKRGAGSRNWPLDPDGFDELIESKQFTNGADKGTVKTLYRKMSKAQLSGIEMLDFTGISAPSVSDMEQLGRCLNLCENLKTCDLSSVGLAADACRALFSTHKVNGVLTDLNLSDNNIGGGTGWIKASEVEGESKDVGAKVIYKGREMVVSVGVDSDGELQLVDVVQTGVLAIAKVLEVNGVLTTLKLGSNRIGDEGAKALADALRVNGVLTNLVLEINDIGPEGAAAIAEALRGNGVLTDLNLWDNNIGNEGAKALASALRVNGVLKTLNLDGHELDLPKLRGTDPVESLDLSGERLGPESAIVIASLIAGNAVLTNLDLTCCGIGDEGAKALASALRVNGVLKNLDLGENEIGDEGAKAIGKALAVNEVLKNINLLRNNITVEGAAPLVKLFRERRHMESLCGFKPDQTVANFAGWQLGPADAMLIGADLEFNGVLNTLNLSYNGIGLEGAKAIGEALAVNGVLTDLDLSSNNIGGETDYIKASEVEGESKEVGAKVIYQGREMVVSKGVDSDGELKLSDVTGVLAIADALKVNGVLTTLDLRGNSLGTEGWCAIFAALRDNKENKIESWDLSSQGINTEIAKVLAEYVSVSGVLKSINLKYNRMGEEGKGAIRDAVNGREGFELEM